jgi:hypothetical protein
MRWLGPVFVAALLGILVVSSAGARPASSGQALYTNLLKQPYPNSALPSGYHSAEVSKTAASKLSVSHHVIGDIAVEVIGPDVTQGLVYYVFPTAADAKSDFDHPERTQGQHLAGKIAGYPESFVITGGITGKNAAGKTVTNGITGDAILSGTVIVASFTLSDTKTKEGNGPGSLALVKSGLKHLAAVAKLS